MIDAGEAGTGEFSALHVLVIDDQEHVRRWIARVLRGMGVVQIAEAEDGASALARVTAPGAHFDFILSDLRMPNTDGVELIRALAAAAVTHAGNHKKPQPVGLIATEFLFHTRFVVDTVLGGDQLVRTRGHLHLPAGAGGFRPALESGQIS